jgi:hypothetical protein
VPSAHDELRKWPEELQRAVAYHLRLLEEAPVEHCRSAPTPPYRPGFQMYQFDWYIDGVHNEVTVLFKYGADERTLWIEGFGRIVRREL